MTPWTSPQDAEARGRNASAGGLGSRSILGRLRVSMEPVAMVTKPQRQDSSRARKDKLLSCPYPRSLTGGGGGKWGQSGFLSQDGSGGREKWRLSSCSMGRP